MLHNSTFFLNLQIKRNTCHKYILRYNVFSLFFLIKTNSILQMTIEARRNLKTKTTTMVDSITILNISVLVLLNLFQLLDKMDIYIALYNVDIVDLVNTN
jgi:hypothetical protein